MKRDREHFIYCNHLRTTRQRSGGIVMTSEDMAEVVCRACYTLRKKEKSDKALKADVNTHICEWCGSDTRQKYCSPACKLKASAQWI